MAILASSPFGSLSQPLLAGTNADTSSFALQDSSVDSTSCCLTGKMSVFLLPPLSTSSVYPDSTSLGMVTCALGMPCGGCRGRYCHGRTCQPSMVSRTSLC